MKISKLVLSAVCLMLLTGCQSNESMLIKKFPEQENIISSLSDELVGAWPVEARGGCLQTAIPPAEAPEWRCQPPAAARAALP